MDRKMERIRKLSAFAIAAAVLLSDCNKSRMEIDDVGAEIETEANDDMGAGIETEANNDMGSETKEKANNDTETETKAEIYKGNSNNSFFPFSYTGGTEKVKYDCVLEIPDGFDPFHFYMPKVSGLQCVDQDEAYKIGVGEQEIKD